MAMASSTDPDQCEVALVSPANLLRGGALRGPAVALIRPHEIGLLPGPGPARVESQHLVGPMYRTLVALNDNVFDVLATEGTWVRAAGQTCNLDLSRARIYRFEQSAGP